MKFPKFVGAVMIAAAVTAGLAACGSDDGSDDIPTIAATSSSTASDGSDVTNPDSPPSVATLNQMLDTALDPSVPKAQKVVLVQNSEKDPAIFDRLVRLKSDNPGATYTIKGPVTADGPNQASVRVTVKLPDQSPQDIDAQIVYDDGRWKLSSEFVCPLITGNGVETAMCPAPSTRRTTTSRAPN